MNPEREIEKSILSWLAAKKIYAFKIKTVGTFDPTKNIFRKPGKWYKSGVSDILGIFQGRPLAIEVKTKAGRLTENQKIFLQEWEENGGISILARSVKDVEEKLESIINETNTINSK